MRQSAWPPWAPWPACGSWSLDGVASTHLPAGRVRGTDGELANVPRRQPPLSRCSPPLAGLLQPRRARARVAVDGVDVPVAAAHPGEVAHGRVAARLGR